MRRARSKSCSISLRLKSVIVRKSRFAIGSRVGQNDSRMRQGGFYPGERGGTRLIGDPLLQDVLAQVLVLDDAHQPLAYGRPVEDDVLGGKIGQLEHHFFEQRREDGVQ